MISYVRHGSFEGKLAVTCCLPHSCASGRAHRPSKFCTKIPQADSHLPQKATLPAAPGVEGTLRDVWHARMAPMPRQASVTYFLLFQAISAKDFHEPLSGISCKA